MRDRPVVVGVDGSPSSLAAVDWAFDEAARRRLPLRVVHAAVWAHYDNRSSRSLADSVTHDAQTRARARQPSAVVAVDVALRDSVPALLAEGESAALLVLGSRALGRLRGALLGSASRAVVAQAACPVVVVHDLPSRADHDGAVVLGVGDQGEAAPVADFAFVSAAARGCPLRAVHAWRVPHAEDATAHTGQFDDARTSRREQARRRLDDVTATVRGAAASVEVDRVLGEGPALGILVEASAGASLLVVGARRNVSHDGHRLGPVNRAVLRHAPCPVAVVPHD